MTMYYVADPDTIVAKIQSLLESAHTQHDTENTRVDTPANTSESIEHTIDTRGKVREVLE